MAFEEIGKGDEYLNLDLIRKGDVVEVRKTADEGSAYGAFGGLPVFVQSVRYTARRDGDMGGLQRDGRGWFCIERAALPPIPNGYTIRFDSGVIRFKEAGKWRFVHGERNEVCVFNKDEYIREEVAKGHARVVFDPEA